MARPERWKSASTGIPTARFMASSSKPSSCTHPSTSTAYAPCQAAQSPSHTPCIPKQTSLCFGPGGEDSNPRPPTWNDGALPSELHPDWRARLDSNQQLQVPLQPCADLPHYRYATTPLRHDHPCSPHAAYETHHTAGIANREAFACHITYVTKRSVTRVPCQQTPDTLPEASRQAKPSEVPYSPPRRAVSLTAPVRGFPVSPPTTCPRVRSS